MKKFKVVLFPIEKIELEERIHYVYGDRMAMGDGTLQIFDGQGKSVYITHALSVDYCISTGSDAESNVPLVLADK